MQTFKIEKDIPMRANKVSAESYPFDKMQVGDSFRFNDPKHWAKRVSNAEMWYSKKHGVKFTVRCAKTTGRIWRIK